MELNGEVAIDAPRERVWAALNDSAVLRACIPGCEEVVDESPTERRARVMVKIGPVRARFSGKVVLSDVVAPARCVLGFEGSGGAAGMASGRSQVELVDGGDSTRLTYTVKASVGGKLGQIGGRMIDASAKQLADQFFAALQAHLAPAPVVEEASAQAPQLPTPAPIAEPAMAPSRPHGPAPLAAQPALRIDERVRMAWFLLGVASTAVGVWLGKVLF